MEHSEQINELAPALAKAQGEMENAKKTSENPFFHSTYADLAEVWDTCRKPLSDNGLSVIQSPSAEGGIGEKISKPTKDKNGNITGSKDVPMSNLTVTTMLLHTSGQWFKDAITILCEIDSQSVGSTIEYMRRYSLKAMIGLASEDDDSEGNTGHEGDNNQPEKKPENRRCEIHNVPLYHHAGKDGKPDWYSHKIKDSNPVKYCDGTLKEEGGSSEDRNKLCSEISAILKKSGTTLAAEMNLKYGADRPDVPQLQSWLADLETSFENL